MKWSRCLFRRGNCLLFKRLFNLGIALTVFNQFQIIIVQGQTYCEERPKILYYRREHAALVSGPGSEEVANHVVVSNVNKEFLACVSSRNVEWVYEGEGEPSKFQESSTVDIQNYDDDSISYCLTSQITFYNKQSDTELSRHTGRYTCREIGNSSNSATVYLFASRKNSPTFLQSRKTLTLPLGPENITMFPIREGSRSSVSGTQTTSNNDANTSGAPGKTSSSSSFETNKIVSTPVVTIPCVTTHPDVTARLLKKVKNGGFKPYTGGTFQFDPKYGFQLNASIAKPEDLSEFYGEYKCIASPILRGGSSDGSSNAGGRSVEDETGKRNAGVEDFIFVTLVKPKLFKVFPPVTEVYVSGMLNLTCESDEPVIMKEILPTAAQDIYSYLDEDDYGRDRSDDIVETTEKTEQKSHIANYMELAPAPGRTGEIQCLSEKDGRVLHSWKYRIIRKRADKLSGIKFNKRENSFTCKSKLGAPGRLSFISCRTPSECRINKICLMKSENCRGYSNSTRAFCERKTHFCGKIFYKGGSGMIRCVGDGIDEIRGFTDEAATDQVMRMGFGKLKASETALLQLTGVVHENNEGHKEFISYVGKDPGSLTIYEGDQLNVTLKMGYYFFLYPVQWAAKFKNGSTSQITPEFQTLQVDKLTRTVIASIKLPYTKATTFRNSSDNASTNSSNSNFERSPDHELASTSQLSEIIALNALIPLRSSVEPSWKTITLPLTVYGRIGVLQPLSDSESEEILVETPLYIQDAQGHPSLNNSLAAFKNSSALNASMPTTSEGEDEFEVENDEEGSDAEVIEEVVLSNQTAPDSVQQNVSSNNNDTSTHGMDKIDVLLEPDVDEVKNSETNHSQNSTEKVSLSQTPSISSTTENSTFLDSVKPLKYENDEEVMEDETYFARSSLLQEIEQVDDGMLIESLKQGESYNESTKNRFEHSTIVPQSIFSSNSVIVETTDREERKEDNNAETEQSPHVHDFETTAVYDEYRERKKMQSIDKTSIMNEMI